MVLVLGDGSWGFLAAAGSVRWLQVVVVGEFGACRWFVVVRGGCC